MWRSILVIAFNSVAVISVGILIVRGQWRLAPFLFLATMAINFVVVMSVRGKSSLPHGKANRAFLMLAYALIVVAVFNSLRFVEGLSMLRIGGVLGPLGISALLFRNAAKVNSI